MVAARRVLVIDNDAELLKTWRTEIGTSLLVESAFEMNEVRRIFDLSRLEGQKLNGSDFRVIVVTDSVLRATRESLLTLMYLRQNYNGPMIAAADRYVDQLALVKAGCCTLSRKREVPETVYAKLGLLLANGPGLDEELPEYGEPYDVTP